MNKSNKGGEIDLKSEEGIMTFLQNPSLKIAETITGVLVSDSNDWKLSAGKVVQAAIKGNLLTQLGREINEYKDKGKIKEDYFATNKNRCTLYELLKFLDDEIPDEEVFAAVKSIFFSGVSVNANELDEALAYEFLHTAKSLTGTEILILKANFEINSGIFHYGINESKIKIPAHNRASWRRVISEQMGYGKLDSVVAKYEPNLELLCLIAPRNDVDRFQREFNPEGSIFRLTATGHKFCEFITKFE